MDVDCESLKESERHFRAIADSVPMLLWMSGSDKLCTFFNQAWLRFTGRTLEQELGNGWAEGVHPDDFKPRVQMYHAAFDARQPFEIEYRLRRHDGRYRWVLDVGTPHFADSGEFLGYIGSALDVTDRKAAERAMRDSEKLFHSMADSAPVLIWMSGPDKLGVFFNQGWLNFTGRTLEQELGDGWIDGVHPDDRQHCLDVCHATFDTRQPFEVEYRLRRRDGEYRWVLDKGTPRFAEDGEFLGYIGSAIDITDLKGTEDKNRALAHVQRLAIIGEMTAAVAHELRQPSTAIMSNADAALALLDSGEVPSSEMREIVTDIKRANLRANDVLGRIQDFVRKRETPMEVVDLNTLVSDVLLLIGGDTRKRRMKVRTELTENLPAVLGNRMQLQQVLINLLVNGMDAMSNTPDGKRGLVIQTSKPNGDARVQVAVSDSGPGIAPENVPRLFESFFTTRAEGMGLGLSIARSIVDSHGGRIWAENNSGSGATFQFTLPTVMD